MADARSDFSIRCPVCFVRQGSACRTYGWEADIRISPQDVAKTITDAPKTTLTIDLG
jgi:hypothetical protein